MLTRLLWLVCVSGGLLAGVLMVFSAPAVMAAQAYQPMFPEEMLNSLDPATRERFEVLEQENYQRWRNRNPQAPDASEARAHHAETEAMLRRFEESRALEAAEKAAASAAAQPAKSNLKTCRAIAAEIESLLEGGKFYIPDDAGGRRYMSDAEIAARAKSQQKRYKRYCRSR